MLAVPGKVIRLGGLVLALIPVAILGLFAIGEATAGNLTGLVHLVQVVPLVVLMWVAWRWPLQGGLLLVGAASLLAILHMTTFADRLAWPTLLVTEGLLFLPPIVAGVLFLVVAQRADVDHRGDETEVPFVPGG